MSPRNWIRRWNPVLLASAYLLSIGWIALVARWNAQHHAHVQSLVDECRKVSYGRAGNYLYRVRQDGANAADFDRWIDTWTVDMQWCGERQDLPGRLHTWHFNVATGEGFHLSDTANERVAQLDVIGPDHFRVAHCQIRRENDRWRVCGRGWYSADGENTNAFVSMPWW